MNRIERFLEMLHDSPSLPEVFNPWRDVDSDFDLGPQAPELRLNNLRAYLLRRLATAKVLLIAEAPGYQGAKFSGIAMTCERTILGHKPGVAQKYVFGDSFVGHRTSRPNACDEQTQAMFGRIEPTATIVWGDLIANGATEETVLWNVFPFHPHPRGQSLKNRTPTSTEVESCIQIALAIRSIFADASVVSVGATSALHLNRAGVEAATVRHPSFGGKPGYIAGMRRARAELALEID